MTGKTNAEHEISLHTVLKRLEEYNLRVRLDKCKFFAPSITYLGHKINEDGLSTLENKVQGIVVSPTPSNVSQLRSFLGTVNYYGNFIPNLSTRLAPLNNLLKVKTKWDWTQDCNEAFLDIKKCLSTSPVLAHFDPNERLVVACDASPYGVAAVLSHRYASGSERPIAYASRTLSPAEKNYSQNDREALAVMFGVKKIPGISVRKNFHLSH